MSRAILLVDHGSRRDDANAMLDALADAVRRRAGDVLVRTAHLEIAKPGIGDAVDAAVAEGVRELTLVPFFLSPGHHTQRDIPEQAKAATARHPGLRLSIAEPLGIDDKLVEVLLERAAAAREA